MDGKIRAMLKTAKKNNKAELEAKGIQMENELKLKHKEERTLLEEKLSSLKVNNDNGDDDDDNDNDNTNNNDIIDNEESIKAKKLKAQKKKEKRATKEANRLQVLRLFITVFI